MGDVPLLPIFPELSDVDIGAAVSRRMERKASYEPSRTLMSVPKTSKERSISEASGSCAGWDGLRKFSGGQPRRALLQGASSGTPRSRDACCLARNVSGIWRGKLVARP